MNYYLFKKYWVDEDIKAKLIDGLTLLEIKSTDPDDTINTQAGKLTYIIKNYCHSLMNRHIAAKDDTWIKDHIEDVVTHNLMDMVAVLETTRILLPDYGKLHTHSTAQNYRTVGGPSADPAMETENTVWNEQDNLAKAFELLNSKNRCLDRIYADLEIITIPFIGSDTTFPDEDTGDNNG